VAGRSMRVVIDVVWLAEILVREGRRYVTRSYVSRRLGVNTRTAGKILSRMAELGLARRYSISAYEITALTPKALVDAPRSQGHEQPEDAQDQVDAATTSIIEG